MTALDLEAIVSDQVREGSAGYELAWFDVEASSRREPLAKVAVRMPDGAEAVGESGGDGPVDAIFGADPRGDRGRVGATPVHGLGGHRGRGRARRGDRDAPRRTAASRAARASPPTSSRPRRAPTCGRCRTRSRAPRCARPRASPPRRRASRRRRGRDDGARGRLSGGGDRPAGSVSRFLHPRVRILGRLRGDLVRLPERSGRGRTGSRSWRPTIRPGLRARRRSPGTASCSRSRSRTRRRSSSDSSGSGSSRDHPLTDEPWGQRRFGIRDPAGVWVDVVEQIEPAPGFWDQYASPAG